MQVEIHKDLIQQCANNDRLAQQKVYSLYAKAMFNTSFRILNDFQLAEDVLQESFIIAFTKLNTFNFDASFGSWLKKIVINKSLNELQKNQKMSFSEDLENSIEENETSDFSELNIQLIKQASSLLPKSANVILNLYAFEGYDHQEISEILGITVAGSKSQYSRAKKKIRELIHTQSCKTN